MRNVCLFAELVCKLNFRFGSIFKQSSIAFSSWRNADDLSLIKYEKGVGKSPFNPRANITTLMTLDGKMFIGSATDFSGADSAILRADLSISDSKILRTKQYNSEW